MRLVIYIWKKLALLSALLIPLSLIIESSGGLSILRRLHAVWRDISQIKRGILVGIFLAFVTQLFNEADAFRKVEDAGLDWMISMYRGVPRPETTSLRPIVFLDIDERSYRHWGEPMSAPRDKVLRLIRYAVESGASIVMVDVELSRTISADDNAINDYLSGLAQRMTPPPEIILARGLRLPTEPVDGLIEQRQSFLDDVPNRNPHVHWAAPLFQVDEDAVVRRWRLWETTCEATSDTAQGRAVTLPSFQLLATVLIKDPNNPSRLKQALQEHIPPGSDCATKAVKQSSNAIYNLGGVQFRFSENDLEKRILYSLPWRLKKGERYPSISWKGEPEYPLFSIKPAVVVTEGLNISSDLKGQVVIIGSSYADTRDIFPTPLGSMPGAIIIANAFLSFYQNGEVAELPWLENALRLVLIVAVAVVFAYLPNFTAKMIASAITLLLLIPATFLLFTSGVWLDFAIPLMAVEFHAMYGEFDEKISAQHHRKNTVRIHDGDRL